MTVPGWFRPYAADPKHGPLPILLLLLTVTTGLVDAVSILALGRVFVANMTGNVVFLGFAIAGAPGFSLAASLFALGGFLLGAAAGGAAGTRLRAHRGHLLRDIAAAEFVLFAIAAIILAVGNRDPGVVARSVITRSVIAAILAIGMGAQNAAARQLAVPDLTTTVLTMTLTGLVADIRTTARPVLAKRLVAVIMMLGGAAIGALLVLHTDVAAPVVISALLALVVAVCAGLASRSGQAWHHPA